MSISEPAYSAALAKTKTIFGDQGEGFVTASPGATIAAKQLNTVIELLLTLHGKITALEGRLQDLKEDIAKKADKPNTSGLDKQFDDLTKKIEGLRSGSQPKQPVVRGKLKVKVNPFDLLKKIQ
jgi:C4-type Zn-finger protein|nr:ORF2 [Sugarcane bacilliform virus]